MPDILQVFVIFLMVFFLIECWQSLILFCHQRSFGVFYTYLVCNHSHQLVPTSSRWVGCHPERFLFTGPQPCSPMIILQFRMSLLQKFFSVFLLRLSFLSSINSSNMLDHILWLLLHPSQPSLLSLHLSLEDATPALKCPAQNSHSVTDTCHNPGGHVTYTILSI